MSSFDPAAARAITGLNQWSALAARMKPSDVLNEVVALPRFTSIKKSKMCNVARVRQYLCNGWSTETLLGQNIDAFSGEALKNSLVWAYPQAYYSVFAVALAYFEVSGYSQTHSHFALIRKVGEEMEQGRYPQALSPLVKGGRDADRIFLNCARHPVMGATLKFDAGDPKHVDHLICGILNKTRQIDLETRLKDNKQLRTKDGKPKKSFSAGDYANAASNLGNTSILSFLYRKRIKSNYEDIDSILSEHVNAEALFPRIRRVVRAFAFVHEAYIAQALGNRLYKSLIHSMPAEIQGPPSTRHSAIEKNLG